MSNNHAVEFNHILEMICPLLKVGEPATLRQWQKCDTIVPTFDDQSHILVYWGPENQEFVALQDRQQYKIVDIQPITPNCSPSFYDRIIAESHNTHSFLECLQNQLLKDCVEQCQKTNETQPKGACLFCDVSACCYVLLAQDGVQGNGLMKRTEYSPKEQNHKSLADIDALRSMLERNESILKYNKHHREYLDLIEKAVNLETDIPERHNEGLAFAWLLANTERSETALRFWKSSGEINDFEEYDVKNVRDARFSLLKSFANRFMEQASTPSCKNLIWAVLNFTMFLLELAFYPKCFEPNTEKFDDFMGIYPTIDEDGKSYSTLNTVSPIQYSPQFAYTFLCIPTCLKYRFSGYLRQLLHEFFHYVQPDTRKARNHLILKLFGCWILSKNVNDKDVKKLVEFLYYHYNRLGDESDLFQDSMSFITIMRVVLNRVDIEQYLNNQGFYVDSKDFPSKSEQIERLLSYTFFFREVRSDISMIKLLNAANSKNDLMGLSEYIRLMANETDWSSLSAEEAAIDSILRFGFMTHWLSKDSDDPDRIRKEIEDQAKSYPSLEQEYMNLMDYLEEYEKERKIIESCDSDLRKLTAIWAEEDEFLQRIMGNDPKTPCSFWKDFISLYDKSDFEQDDYSFETAKKDFGIMLLLLNLPYYKKYYIDRDTNE